MSPSPQGGPPGAGSPPPQGAGGRQMPPMGPMQSLPAAAGQPGGSVDLQGVMGAYQAFQIAAQELAQGLPPLSPFLAQVLTQLGQAIPDVIMAAGGMGMSPGGPPQMGGPQPGQPGAGGPGAPVGAPPAPPPMMG